MENVNSYNTFRVVVLYTILYTFGCQLLNNYLTNKNLHIQKFVLSLHYQINQTNNTINLITFFEILGIN